MPKDTLGILYWCYWTELYQIKVKKGQENTKILITPIKKGWRWERMDGPGSNFGLERFREKRPPSVCVCALNTYQRSTIIYLISHIGRFWEKRPVVYVCALYIYAYTTSDFPPKRHGWVRNVALQGNLAAGKLGGGFGYCFSSLWWRWCLLWLAGWRHLFWDH